MHIDSVVRREEVRLVPGEGALGLWRRVAAVANYVLDFRTRWNNNRDSAH